ncbi:histidine kinase [Glaciibacter flavus]|uniref:Histidine kinase n=1 Tax=Orlajensenia flava TaxID=2565934 RepID=A0A4S4G0M5_9MICO|nr:ATP-binding protein [Glaciibacter flavus]THG35666.1 histidine kinase [Glaciibacter flavus]
MKRILKERDRLLRRTARLGGLMSVAMAVIVLCVPGTTDAITLAVSLILLALASIALYLLGWTGQLRWVAATLVIGLAAITVIGFGDPGHNESSTTAVIVIAGGVIAAAALILPVSTARIGVFVAGFIITAVVATFASAGYGAVSMYASLFVVAGWASAGLVGWWMGQSVPRVMHRIASVGRAHRSERQASEREAQRRQDARLLHDTVLATLTLLAHSGVGVSEHALRLQAADDARLLRQLRLGGKPMPRASGVYTLEPVAETELGTTLESVKQRFSRMGLEVSWHGHGQVLLPSNVLDSFLGALGECLENVRRHAEVTEADVTITDDDTTVRAMVTDSGVGFDIGQIADGRLGFAESVVARLRDVGGNARLFSSPGSGTTVVLEVPK